jgi:hypothetical protein
VAADDTGDLGDGVTSNPQPGFTGTAEPGGIVQLLNSADAVIGTATVAADGSYVVRPDAAFPADGTYDLRVVARDAAGNASLPSAVLRLTINSRLPGAPTLSMVRADDSGNPPNGRSSARPPPAPTGRTCSYRRPTWRRACTTCTPASATPPATSAGSPTTTRRPPARPSRWR